MTANRGRSRSEPVARMESPGSRFRAPEGKLREIRSILCPHSATLHASYGEATMSFWKSLFGGGSSESEGKPSAPVEYNGFTIRAAPYKSEGQYQTAGTITKEIGGGAKKHKIIPPDPPPAHRGAGGVLLRKARPIVGQPGGRTV